MLNLTAWLFASACSRSEPPPPPDPAPTVSEPEAALLAAPPPATGPVGQLMERVAARYGVGWVRCPLADGGRARQRFGTERDQLWSNGPTWALEIDPAEGPPWDVLFDTVVSEGGWLTALAAPGATTNYVATRDRVVEYTFPAVRAGHGSVCTAARTVPFRSVKGQVSGSIAPGTYVFPCLDPAPDVGGDGSFLVSVPAPCRLWVEGPGGRSSKVEVAPADERLEVALALSPDPLQTPDRRWTPAGIQAADRVLGDLDTRWLSLDGWLAEQAEAVADPALDKVIHKWRFDHAAWGRNIQRSQAEIDAAAGRPPRPVDRASPDR